MARIIIVSRNRKLYSTRRLVETAQDLGHDVKVVHPLKCRLTIGRRRPEMFFRGAPLRPDDVDVVIGRIGASITEFGLATIRQLEVMGVHTVSESQAIARSRDKLRCMQLLSRHDIGIPRTVMVHKPEGLRDFIQAVGGPPVILKLLQGTQGVGVMLADTFSAAESVLDAMWSIGQNIIVQEYVAESTGRDLRCIVVGGRVLACMTRQAAAGEFRSNIHRGGHGEYLEPTTEVVETALAASEVLRLDIAGVDMLLSKKGPLVMEVNHSPGLQGIEGVLKAVGRDHTIVARGIIEHAVSTLPTPAEP